MSRPRVSGVVAILLTAVAACSSGSGARRTGGATSASTRASAAWSAIAESRRTASCGVDPQDSFAFHVGDPPNPVLGALPLAHSIHTPPDPPSHRLHVDGTSTISCRADAPTSYPDVVYRTVTTRYGRTMDLHMDVLVPPDPGPMPGVVFIPGGGFFSAIRSLAVNRRRYVADEGFVVASVEYRTLDDGTYADAVSDVKAAIRYLRTHASEYRLDPARVGVWGESAGGYLAAMVGTTNGVRQFDPAEPGPSTAVQGVVDVYGLSDLTRIGADYDAATQAAHRSPSITEAAFVNGKDRGLGILDDRAAARRANPITYVTRGDPPFLLFHGSRDGLVSPSQTALLRRALAAHGVPVTRYLVDGAGHAGPEWSTNAAMQRLVTFLAATLSLSRAP
jgi:acetyl esterase/lipase